MVTGNMYKNNIGTEAPLRIVFFEINDLSLLSNLK